jgi:hypothetical protein
MRSISRVADVSINTVSKLLVDAGKACATPGPAAFPPAFIGAMIGGRSTAHCKLVHYPPAREGPHDQDDQHVQDAVSRNRFSLLRGVL